MNDKRSLPLTPLWLIALSAVGIGSVVAAAFFSGRGGHLTVVIPWFIPAVNSLLFLISASVSFLAFGRYGIIGDSSSFWVGMGSSQFAVGMLFNTLTFPGLTAGGGQLMGRLSNTAAWEAAFAVCVLGICLLVASLARWPGRQSMTRFRLRLTIALWLLCSISLYLLFAAFEEYLPILSRGGVFTRFFTFTIGYFLGSAAAIGSVLSIRRFFRSCDPLIAYVSISQLSLLAIAMLTLIEVNRYDIFWYVQRLLWVAGFAVMHFGLLSEYVSLFRREQEKIAELRARSEELEKSEERLTRSEATLRLAVDATGLGTFDYNPRTGELIWSDQAKRNFGLSPESPASYELFLAAIHPEDRERAAAVLQQAIRDRSSATYSSEYRTVGIEDHKERWLISRGHVFFGDDGEAVRVVGATLDITERKRAESRLRRIFESGIIGIFYWNMSGEIIDANSRFLAMVGRTEEELRAGAIRWGDLTPPEYAGVDREASEELNRTGVAAPYEKEFVRTDGSRVPVIIGGALIGGTRDEGVSFILDITDRKHAEEELRKARDYLEVRVQERTEELTRALEHLKAETGERIRAVEELRIREQMLMQQSRLAAMGEMLANISHQWRQPLNVVSLLLQGLVPKHEQGNLSGEFLEKSVTRATELIEQMSGTIDDFSNYLQPDRVKLPFDLREVVEKALAMVGETLWGIEVSVESVGQTPSVTGYRNEYVQVVINILMNARDALLERGVQEPRILIRIFTEEGRGVVTIADNAGGISGDVIGKIFEPYFTTKEPGKGTGIGLFMAKSIIEKSMEGQLSVRNSTEGAEFRIEV
jgi:PAS domain S-box-containing protein